MNMKWLIIIAVVLGCVFVWDMSCKSAAQAVVDDVYLNLGDRIDGTNRALLEKSDTRIRSSLTRTVIFNKQKIRRAAEMIRGQRISLDGYLEDLKTMAGRDASLDVVKDVSQTIQDQYSSSVTKFKHDLEYVRRGL